MAKYYSKEISKSPRIDILKKALFANKPRIEADRAVLLTESYKATENLPIVERRARAFSQRTHNNSNLMLNKYNFNPITLKLIRKVIKSLHKEAKLKNGTICQIEMQMTDKKNTVKRILYYWSRTYAEQIRRGEDYQELNKTIGIIITNYEVEELKEIEDLDTKWQIINDKNDKRLLTEDLELRIIEIPKARKIIEKEKYNRIAQWLMFLDNPNTERVEEIMKENEEVKKAKSVLYVMSEDE